MGMQSQQGDALAVFQENAKGEGTRVQSCVLAPIQPTEVVVMPRVDHTSSYVVVAGPWGGHFEGRK